MAIVREDVVKLVFDIKSDDLEKTNDAVDELFEMMKELGGSGGTGKAEDGFEDAAKAAKQFGDTKLNKLDSALDGITRAVGQLALKLGKTSLKGLATGITLGTTALVGLGKASVEAYAEYEQLKGGVETLFGGDSLTVLANANSAWERAGVSANEYMTTVTSFSASLINSLGGDTEKAVSVADTALVDMSDNANKMGTDMSLIQNAYSGFAKGNFTMLDNLKLGFGGTQEEMQRLLDTAEGISGKDFDIANFADIVEAIHVIQDDMGIAGATAEEAATTIQGSAVAMGAAWKNFITGLSDENADFDALFDNLVQSVVTFGSNLIPRIKILLPRLVRGVTQLAQALAKELPSIMTELLPEIVRGGISLMGSLGDVFKSILPAIKQTGLTIIQALYEGLTGKSMPEGMLGDISDKIDEIFNAAKNIVNSIINTLRPLVPIVEWAAGIVVDAFIWVGDNAEWLTPILGGLLGALLAFRGIRKISGVFSGITSLFGKKGGVAGSAAGAAGGAGGGGLFSSFANIKPTTILKGIGNLAIVVGALGALAAVVMALAPEVAKLYDGDALLKVGAVMGGVAVVGTVTAELAGIVGKIPITAVLTGLGNIALAIGAIELIVVAFAALNSIPGFAEFQEKGGELLADLAGIIGNVIGTFISEIGVGLTSGLPAIGENLSAFATNLQPMIDIFANNDTSGISDFAGAFAAFLGAMALDQLSSWLFGETDYVQLATDLTDFATGLGGFFTALEGIPSSSIESAGALFTALSGVSSLPTEGGIFSWFTGDIAYDSVANGLKQLSSPAVVRFFAVYSEMSETAFSSASALFECLSGVSNLPSEGGVFQWFTGDIAYDSLANGMKQLSSTSVLRFFSVYSQMPETAYTAATNLFNCLAGVKNLPSEGGVFQFFTGTINYASVVAGLEQLSSYGAVRFFNIVSGIPETGFTAATALFNCLAGVSGLPSEGGIFGWFGGSASEGLSNIASQLPGVGTNVSLFFKSLQGRTDFSPIKSLFDTLSGIKIDSDAASKGFLSLGKSDLEAMGDGLTAFVTKGALFFNTVLKLPSEQISGFIDAVGGVSELPTKVEGLDETVGTALTNMATSISTSLTSMVTSINDAYTSFYDAGGYIMDGLNAGLASRESTLISTATSIATAISTAINNAMQIHSPSRITMESGKFVGQGLALGMESTTPTVKKAAVDMSSAAIPYFRDISPDSTVSNPSGGGNTSTTTVSPVFNLTINGSEDSTSLARQVKRFVAEAIEETFASLESKTYAVREV